MDIKRFNSDSKLNRKKIPFFEEQIEHHLLPKFLLSDLIDKSEREDRIMTDSTRDGNLELNFSNLDIYDSHEENDPIFDDYVKLNDVFYFSILLDACYL